MRPVSPLRQVACPQKGVRGQDLPTSKTLHAVDAKHMPGKSLRTSAGSSLAGNLGACCTWAKAATTMQVAITATECMTTVLDDMCVLGE